MKLKGTFTDHGIRVLEKGFLPTLEKCGKRLQMLLSEDEVNLIQTPLNTDGPCVNARFAVDVLFHPETYKMASKHQNLIAFSVDIGLFLRVLRSANANTAETLEVRLTRKAVSVAGDDNATVVQPFLTFTARSSSMTLVQDLPISDPYTRPEIDRLAASKEVAALSPYYVDLVPCTAALQAMVDKMKSISRTLSFAASKSGDIFLDVSATNVHLGLQLRHLPVFPTTIRPAVEPNRRVPVEEQLRQAVAAGDAVQVNVPLKHLARILAVSTLSGPSQILCGVGEPAEHVHVMFVYRNPLSDAVYDDTIAQSFKVPVTDE
mmetsp:Transcript_21501/g.36658  ORF Transcript_21501/g.36658 Transcript_21501/m.36658 type:complete len:319 (+) Transcript_21501:144-1100(+)|eukprot:CAMPEP_0119102750 /NCGR_PEP_ID=MMETSP1180-20130426/1380_1 /TAXON_ID=3052 ORGANISM="Chlamydomonas cf sp, Strain CCMP681" /NCGR_SAMPLE_ID=MMETSP1180 /ASSEMBLY_ACC=CAM_ASM_000741 /LENGTH=318 /DNA_ID=CAMNT_0007087081 /DNA_START=144 /DNA_END=1100 /DNA_ORIENTATION=+